MNNILERLKRDIDNLKIVSLNEKVINDSKFLEIKDGRYFLNNGKSLERVSVHKKIGSGNGACVFAVTKDKKIVLILISRPALPTKDKVSIEIPAGYIEKNELSIAAAKRELEEETGFITDNIFLVDSYYPSLGVSSERIDLYLAIDVVKEGKINLDSDEFIIEEHVSLEELKYLLDNNYILDSNVRIGYYKYLEYLKERK